MDFGPLIDADLELVTPDECWADALVAALHHPLTRRDMPAVAETTRPQIDAFIARTVGGFDSGEWAPGVLPAYHFWMRRRTPPRNGDPEIVGGLNLRIGGGFNVERVIGHIGYHVYPFARGHHYAERSCRLLLPLARHHDINPLWITCNPDNYASRRTCERLGARLTEIVAVPRDHALFAKGETKKCLYRIDL
jgi:tagatose 1,6-diphosphate aldolase